MNGVDGEAMLTATDIVFLADDVFVYNSKGKSESGSEPKISMRMEIGSHSRLRHSDVGDVSLSLTSSEAGTQLLQTRIEEECMS